MSKNERKRQNFARWSKSAEGKPGRICNESGGAVDLRRKAVAGPENLRVSKNGRKRQNFVRYVRNNNNKLRNYSRKHVSIAQVV